MHKSIKYISGSLTLMKISKERPPLSPPLSIMFIYIFATIFVSLNKWKKSRINPSYLGHRTGWRIQDQGRVLPAGCWKIGNIQPSSWLHRTLKGYRVNLPFIWEMAGWASIEPWTYVQLSLRAGVKFNRVCNTQCSRHGILTPISP